MKYLVNEYFSSMQGEGYYTGTPSFFIRMQGCDVGCPFCDTKYTWSTRTKQVHHSELKANSPEHALMGVEDFWKLTEFEHHIVITGGEPCMQDLNLLTSDFIHRNKSVQIETSGTEEIKVHPKTWVTLSPKIDNPAKKPILESCVFRANEYKFPVATIEDVYKVDEFLAPFGSVPELVWLQPISQDPSATEISLDAARRRGWRVSIQTHKYMGLR